MRPTPKEFFYLIFLVSTIHVYLLLRCKHAVHPLDNWGKAAPRNISKYLNLEVKNLPKNFCDTPKTLLIMVHSQPNSRKARTSIRQTWGNQSLLSPYNASLFFLLGQTRNLSTREITKEENLQHGDIIVEDFVDTYANLTLKSVAMLKLFQYQDKCEYLLKVDEDVFVNVKNLVSAVQDLHDEDLLMGRMIRNERRKNDYYQPWYAPKYMFLGHTYPPFLAGPAYVMSFAAARRLYKAALQLPLFHLEDVFVTGICAEEAGIQRRHSSLFTDFGVPYKICLIVKLISAHSFRADKMMNVLKLYNKWKFNKQCLKSLNKSTTKVRVLT